jgi:hypothetical protein
MLGGAYWSSCGKHAHDESRLCGLRRDGAADGGHVLKSGKFEVWAFDIRKGATKVIARKGAKIAPSLPAHGRSDQRCKREENPCQPGAVHTWPICDML